MNGSLEHWFYVPCMAFVPASTQWHPPGTVTSELAGYAVGD
ncbi:hypothetical protein JOD67_006736 [Tenggerimyces flavus]|nr:hypothetical protein [Tenggerimyces flavus]